MSVVQSQITLAAEVSDASSCEGPEKRICCTFSQKSHEEDLRNYHRQKSTEYLQGQD